MNQNDAGKKSGLFGWYFNSNLLVRILIGLILGAVAGIAFGPKIACVAPLGTAFVRLLKMIVMPVVVFTLVVGAASVNPKRLGRIGVKGMVLYLLTSGFAVALGLIFANLFTPGDGMALVGVAGSAGKMATPPSVVDTLLNIIPTNPFGAITSGKMLPTIFFAIFFGIGLSHLRESDDERIQAAAQTVYSFFEGGAEVMYKVVNWILEFAPFGVFALIAVVFGK
ncbi:cation:dicarboxylase symporter family transporter, partial [Desulfoluna sp.]|uniref:dicarboxylate/amino acid:cation symporter n=1 Tax=Desulfoluna sp. TaxID=2045199 RepID=UPI00262B4E85